jgi:putative sigma-54 modulation protein
VLSAERHIHRVDINLQLHNGFQVAGHETTENMYSSIDLVSAKIERQVRRYKDKLRSHKVRDLTPVPVVHSVIHEPGDQQDGARSSGVPEVERPVGLGSGNHHVIQREQVDARPLSVSEAIMQLNLLHADFHVFRNSASGLINVVYRRADGAYGLIETSPPRQ